MAPISYLLSAYILLATATATELPSYITPCYISDQAKLDECVLTNSRQALKYLVHGDSKLGIPSLDPWSFEGSAVGKVSSPGGIGFALAEGYVYGVAQFYFVTASVDLEKQTMIWELENKSGLQVVGNCEVSGNILLSPITGSGKINMTISVPKSTVTAHYDLVEEKGVKYMKFTDVEMTSHINNIYFKFEYSKSNLLLGDRINSLFNANWRVIAKEFEPVFDKVLATAFSVVLTGVFGPVPYDEVFLVK